jgi:hypothetical protein
MVGMSIKRGYKISFIAKQPYLDHSNCQLIYLRVEHKNKLDEVCHRNSVFGFQHTLGSQLSNVMEAHLMGLIRQGLSPTQVMAHHKAYVKEQALRNELITQDTFVLSFDVKNLAKK